MVRSGMSHEGKWRCNCTRRVSEDIPVDLAGPANEVSAPVGRVENAGAGIPQRWLRRSGLMALCDSCHDPDPYCGQAEVHPSTAGGVGRWNSGGVAVVGFGES